MLKEVNSMKNFNLKLHTRIPMYFTKDQWEDMDPIFTGEKQQYFVQFLVNLVDDKDKKVVVYGHYYRNYLSCLLRQIKAPIGANPRVVDNILAFFRITMIPDLKELLIDLKASRAIFYNHLTHKQQVLQDPLFDFTIEELEIYFTRVFCKADKGTGNAKTRTVSQVNEPDKFVLGPVCFAVEQRIRNKLFGYSPGQSWQEKADKHKLWKDLDLKVVCSDFEGFDRSNSIQMKQIHFECYDLFAQLANLLQDDCFRKHAMAKWVKILIDNDSLPENMRMDKQFITILATVFFR